MASPFIAETIKLRSCYFGDLICKPACTPPLMVIRMQSQLRPCVFAASRPWLASRKSQNFLNMGAIRHRCLIIAGPV
ncbi:hypothetical protein HYQ46_002455 [Verticillium longisporum]|nr:hypothetical protein HYQ46_002455 [Verticillium longisporum]